MTSSQSRDSEGWNVFSEEQRISPKRKEPKKATVAAVQRTCLLSFSQSEIAIW